MKTTVQLPRVAFTTNGMTGACSAAALLARYPDATLRITSARHVIRALVDLAESASAVGELHICGVGIEGSSAAAAEALRAQVPKRNAHWYIEQGAPGFPEAASLLRGACHLHVAAANETLPELVANAVRFQGRERLGFWKELTTLDRAGKRGASEQTRLWQRIIPAANARFFLFADDAANHKAIRCLAGLDEVDAELQATAKEFERHGNLSLPLGSSPAMLEIRKSIGRLGAIPEPVLICGPTGSGKELVARGLHIASGLAGRFVALNCAVLGGSPQLAEDRLFGHVRGAFTSADASKPGAFEQAHEGTLFLDEVGELPLEVQSQLLRVLEEKQVRPLGTMETRPVDVRVVAATHRSLADMVRRSLFREDLFYRLNVLQITVPSLRERREDMRSIAADVRKRLQESGYPLSLSARDWEAIDQYRWPGNIRQFINLLKRAAYLGAPVRDVIAREQAADAAAEPEAGHAMLLPSTPGEVRPAEEIYGDYLRHVLTIFDGNVTRAAAALKLAKNTLRRYSAR